MFEGVEWGESICIEKGGNRDWYFLEESAVDKSRQKRQNAFFTSRRHSPDVELYTLQKGKGVGVSYTILDYAFRQDIESKPFSVSDSVCYATPHHSPNVHLRILQFVVVVMVFPYIILYFHSTYTENDSFFFVCQRKKIIFNFYIFLNSFHFFVFLFVNQIICSVFYLLFYCSFFY